MAWRTLESSFREMFFFFLYQQVIQTTLDLFGHNVCEFHYETISFLFSVHMHLAVVDVLC